MNRELLAIRTDVDFDNRRREIPNKEVVSTVVEY